MKQNVPLVRSFSALEPYQEAYTLACSLETEGQGCWLTVSRTKAPDDPADTARTWVPAPEEECGRLLQFLYENSVQPELWQDAIPAGIRRRSRQKTCGKGARRVSYEEQDVIWRVALASYDPREMRVWTRYLEERNPAIRCTGYRSSRTLLERLEQGDVDVLVLGGRLEDMDSIQFLPKIRGLARKPLVLLRDDGRNEKSAVESLSQEDACYLIRQATLEDMLQELRVPAHRPAESLEKRCERIYRSWGLSTCDANKRYLTGALRMMMGSDHRLAIRKEILGPVAEEYNLTVAAVDSALRRLLETLDETGTQTWRDFRKEYGLERRKVTIGRLLYALESKLSQQ